MQLTVPRAAEIEVACPASGRVVGTVPDLDRTEVERLASQLRAAQPGWENIGPDERAAVLRSWLDWIFDNDRQLVELVQLETGKSWSDARMETLAPAELIAYYAKHAASFLAPRRVRPSSLLGVTKRMEVRYRPHPLVGVISPWNSPIAVPMMDVAGALMAGAAVLSKPSEVTPLAWTELVRGLREVGAPHVLASATGRGPTGEAVVNVVDMVMFTGSTRTGRRIAALAGERLIPYSLELGGKDAMIVLDDADLDRAARAAVWGGMANAGQTCVSVERIYVQAAVHDAFVAKVTTLATQIRQGMDDPRTYDCDIGAAATEAQVQLIEGQVTDALAKGAKAEIGGRRRTPGLFFEPTILTGVDHDMACMRDETFGPLLPIMAVNDDAEAVQCANDSRYGLSASVWSRDLKRARRVASQIEAGAVNVNTALMNLFQFDLPMGGWKESGIGARFGAANGVLKYCRPQSLMIERLQHGPEPQWFPYARRRAGAMARLIRLVRASGWRRRLGFS